MSVRVRRWTDKKTNRLLETWQVDVVFEHPNGAVTRVKKKCPVQTRRGAEQYEREVRQSLLNGSYGVEIVVAKTIPTVAEFAENFLTFSKTNNKPSSVASKKQILDSHLLSVFGTKRLDDIGAYDLEAFKAAKLDEGLAAKTINNALSVLSRMLSLALEWEVIDRVPKVKWMRAPKPAFDFLTFDEADRIVAAAADQWRVMVVLALNTGLRRGEMLALRWEDVDLVAGRLVVRRNVWRGQYGTPKGGRTREIPLNARLLEALRGHRHLRGPLVLCKDTGAALSAEMAEAAIATTCRKAGLRKIGWHALRHTFASQLVMKGVSLKAVQELLGHATIEMTMRYAHLSPDVKKDAVNVLDEPAAPTGKKKDEDGS